MARDFYEIDLDNAQRSMVQVHPSPSNKVEGLIVPDPVKLATLEQAGYKVVPTCSMCVFGEFKPGSSWGSCTTIRYQHQKHTGSKPASAYLSGSCPSIVVRKAVSDDLAGSGFNRFLSNDNPELVSKS